MSFEKYSVLLWGNSGVTTERSRRQALSRREGFQWGITESPAQGSILVRWCETHEWKDMLTDEPPGAGDLCVGGRSMQRWHTQHLVMQHCLWKDLMPVFLYSSISFSLKPHNWNTGHSAGKNNAVTKLILSPDDHKHTGETQPTQKPAFHSWIVSLHDKLKALGGKVIFYLVTWVT